MLRARHVCLPGPRHATLSGASSSLDGRTLNNGATGQAVWSSGTIFGANGARIVNDGLFVNGFDGALVYQTGTLPVFDNKGEFRKAAGAGTTQVGFVDHGAVIHFSHAVWGRLFPPMSGRAYAA